MNSCGSPFEITPVYALAGEPSTCAVLLDASVISQRLQSDLCTHLFAGLCRPRFIRVVANGYQVPSRWFGDASRTEFGFQYHADRRTDGAGNAGSNRAVTRICVASRRVDRARGKGKERVDPRALDRLERSLFDRSGRDRIPRFAAPARFSRRRAKPRELRNPGSVRWGQDRGRYVAAKVPSPNAGPGCRVPIRIGRQ